MTPEFERALAFTLRWEGGYVNDPADPGGETNFGISKRAYPDLDIANLTREDAAKIYERDYWQASGAQLLAPGLAMIVFDSAVQHGVRRAQRWLSQSLQNPTAYLGLREAFYRTLVDLKPSLGKFLKGWLRRLNDLRTAAL